MLYQLGHGQTITTAGARGAGDMPADRVSINEVARIGTAREWKETTPYYPLPDPDPDPQPGLAPRQVFRYYCKDAEPMTTLDDAGAKFKRLADSMAEASLDQKDAAHESGIPPVFTYFGQFIDHDITANTDREQVPGADPGDFDIDRPDFTPQSRDVAEQVKMNLRKGRLELDSVYGDGPNQAPEAQKLEAALRDPDDRAKMRLGVPTQVGGRPELPADDGADLPRVGVAIDTGHLTMDEANALFNADGSKPDDDVRRLALIGDGRNDENLIVAQFHLSILRLHNAMADTLRADGMTDDDAVFAEARKQTVLTYQWLVVHAFLKAVCDPDVVDTVLSDKAPLYSAFYDANKGDIDDAVRPMPMEFSVAAFRYGHSMVRADYDWNRNFGRDVDGNGDGRASFRQMFQFTGGGRFADFGLPTLPDNWLAEWDRMIGTAPMENRVARKIDTELALALNSLENNDPNQMMSRLAERNLRRGFVFNIPTGQAMVKCLYDKGIQVPELSADQIASGSEEMRNAVKDGGFDTATPLWFYVLKEAEVQANGEHLGALGSRLVAETLIGLLVTDERSYLNQGWEPSGGTQPKGEPIEDLERMLRAGGLHA